MINRKGNVLKGQLTLAQGKRPRSVTLGLKAKWEIVRAIMFIKVKFIFRTKEIIPILQQMKPFYSVREKVFVLNIVFSRTVLIVFSFPRAAFRIVPPEPLPWARLYWPFRPKNILIN